MRVHLDIEKYRKKTGMFATPDFAKIGWFEVPREAGTLRIMIADGHPDLMPWEHVSVSLEDRCPTWDEMCFVKNMFFAEDETVIQFHPKASEYVSNHPYCLHLWKPWGKEVELPPSLAVGLKGRGDMRPEAAKRRDHGSHQNPAP